MAAAALTNFVSSQPPSVTALIDQRLAELSSQSKPLLREALNYALLGGKHLRARLLLTAVGALRPASSGQPAPSVLDAACAVELLHSATLLQDDMIDRAEQRRGRPALHLVYGAALTTLASDWLFMRAFRLAHTISSDWADALIAAAQEMIEAEAGEESARLRHSASGRILEVASGKTGSLFAATFQAVALIADLSPSPARSLTQLGRDIGITYQLSDDLNDLLASPVKLGKPRFQDLANGRITLPAALALEELPYLTRADLERRIRARQLDKDELVRLQNQVAESSGTARAIAMVKERREAHLTALQKLFPALAASRQLVDLVQACSHIVIAPGTTTQTPRVL